MNENTSPKLKLHLVAWIDLLGFKDQLKKADTEEKLQEAYRRIKRVQAEFDKATAENPVQNDLNHHRGKKVLALSDGLVIALNLEADAPDARFMALYDRVGMYLEDLKLAQTICAFRGDFVRGAVAIGSFWFEEDILLSPALVEAYEAETDLAKNPVIVLRRDLAEAIRSRRADAGYSPGFDPMANLFRDCEWMEEPARSEHVMLHFLHNFHDDDEPERRLPIFYQQVEAAKAAAPEVAKSKYDWMLRYIEEFVGADFPHVELCCPA
jgi:hypothetical protein